MQIHKSFLIALTLLSTPVLAQTPDARPRPAPLVPNGKMFQEILDKLSLTAEQKDKIKALRKAHKESMKSLRDASEKSRLELDQALDKNLDANALKAAFESFSNARQAVERQRFQQMLDIRNILTDSQRTSFAQLRPKTPALPPVEAEVTGD